MEKKIIYFGNKKFVCELKQVLVRGGRKTIEKVFCREIKDGRADNNTD